MLEPGRRLIDPEIVDVVWPIEAHAGGNAVEPGLRAHPIGDGVIGAGAIAAHAQTADDLARR